MPSTSPWRHIKKQDCPHILELKEDTASDKTSCEVCGETADLRICMTCGAVFCCESHSSHNTEHFQNSDHPFIKPQKDEYNWIWCYKCNAFLD